MTKEQAIEELKGILDYWRYIKMYDNQDEQEAVEYAIKFMENDGDVY